MQFHLILSKIAILEKIHGKIRPLAPSPYQRWESDPFWLSGGFILDFFLRGGGGGGGVVNGGLLIHYSVQDCSFETAVPCVVIKQLSPDFIK